MTPNDVAQKQKDFLNRIPSSTAELVKDSTVSEDGINPIGTAKEQEESEIVDVL